MSEPDVWDGPRTEIIKMFLKVVAHNIGIQIRQKELIKTFMMLSNWKKHWVSMCVIRVNQSSYSLWRQSVYQLLPTYTLLFHLCKVTLVADWASLQRAPHKMEVTSVTCAIRTSGRYVHRAIIQGGGVTSHCDHSGSTILTSCSRPEKK